MKVKDEDLRREFQIAMSGEDSIASCANYLASRNVDNAINQATNSKAVCATADINDEIIVQEVFYNLKHWKVECLTASHAIYS